MVEIRDLPGYTNYLVSSDGKIYRKTARNGFHCRVLDVPVEVSQITVGGYRRATINEGGTPKCCLVHRLVLLTFTGPCPSGLEGSHLNGMRIDNRIENLVWETRQQNHDRKKDHGTHQAGERNSWAKLTEHKVSCIKRELLNGAVQMRLAEKYGVSGQAISDINTGKRWPNVKTLADDAKEVTK